MAAPSGQNHDAFPNAGGIDVIIPVRNGANFLRDCLASVRAQLRDGDTVVVVDDASEDATVEIAHEFGAKVLAMTTSVGPYPARNAAVANSENEYLVFFDMRSRARAGWLESHRRMLSEPDVVLAASEVHVTKASSLAGRIAWLQQPFRMAIHIDSAPMPSYATANLGVARSAFDKVGGFRSVRSGGDADLCFRIQEAGLGRMTVDREIRVDWIPRDSLRDAFDLAFRYGKGRANVTEARDAAAFAAASAAAPPVSGKRRSSAYVAKFRYLFELLRQRPGLLPLALSFVLRGWYWLGYASARWQERGQVRATRRPAG